MGAERIPQISLYVSASESRSMARRSSWSMGIYAWGPFLPRQSPGASDSCSANSPACLFHIPHQKPHPFCGLQSVQIPVCLPLKALFYRRRSTGRPGLLWENLHPAKYNPPGRRRPSRGVGVHKPQEPAILPAIIVLQELLHHVGLEEQKLSSSPMRNPDRCPAH